MNKFIVIDGTDGCGKSTQLELLEKYYKDKGEDIVTLSFPDYSSYPGKCIREDYLEGGYIDKDPMSSTYGASILYASDRYVSFHKFWKEKYESDKIIISGRYTSSNIIHQMSKLPNVDDEWDKYLAWITELEYEHLKLPIPDTTIFLNMPIAWTQKMLDKRYAENGGHKDIHEADIEYLEKCQIAALYAAGKLGWRIVNCVVDNELRSIEDIHNEIIRIVTSM